MRPYGYPARPYRVTWVASPPPGPPGLSGAPGPARRVRRWPYVGPPAYPAPPRWGFPRLVWRTPTTVPGSMTRPPSSVPRVVRQSRIAGSVLWLVALSALLATGGEIWRYTLLVAGRSTALPADVVAVSDALVNTGALLAAGAGLIALVCVLRWLLGIRDVAAGLSGTRPARPDWQVLVGVLVPGLNLFLAGSVLAELEHDILLDHTPVTDRPARPRPSTLVRVWWLLWAASELLGITTLLLGLRSGVQAKADGVLWYATTDLVAAAVAVLTVFVVGGLTALVAPATSGGLRQLRVLSVTDAPAPPLRPARPASATR